MAPMFRTLALAMLGLLLAACAGAPTAEVETRASRPSPGSVTKPAETRTMPPAPAALPPSPAPMPPAAARKGGGYYKDDGPGDNPPSDMASIPDADPRAEPLHRFANRPYAALGQNYVPRLEIVPYKERGIASWYGRRFHGVLTSSGERYDMYGMTAAHPTLPIPSYARVTNVDNGKSVVVRINDRGPFHADRVIDLSYTAAWKLGYVSKGSTRVEVEAIVPEGVAMLGKSVAPLASSAAKPDAPPPGRNDVLPTAIESRQADVMPAAAMPSMGEAQARAPVVATEPVASATEMPVGIYLQLGAFSSGRNAEDFREYARQELGSLKQQLLIVTDTDKGRERFRLHLGPFTSAGAAREAGDRVAGKLKLKPFLVQR